MANSTSPSAIESMDVFDYSPLRQDNSEFRLLRVLPGNAGEDVRCGLETYPQLSAPKYKALSYTWGGQSQNHQIFLGERHLFVTANLLAALKQLRHMSEDLLIWIDAICINQNAVLNEKGDQVSKMRSIYEGASEVLVWLGISSDNSSNAFRYMYDVVALSKGGGDVESFILNPGRFDDFMAFHLLLQRDYWQRMWVIQETNVAKKIIIHCGGDTAKWTDLLEVQEVLMNNEKARVELSKAHNIGMSVLNKIWTSGARGMKPSRVPDVGSAQEATIYQSLLYHLSKFCTFPIDRVYSIVGLTSARSDKRFSIDYSRDVRQVFIDVAHHTIATTRKLDIICALQPVAGSRQSPNADIPSWVPDWAAELPYENSISNNLSTHSAAANTPPNVSFSADGHVILAKGFAVATISMVGQASGISNPYDADNDDISHLLQTIHSWRAMLQSVDASVPRNLDRAFLDTITCGVFYNRFFPDWGVEKYLSELLGLYGMLCKQYHPDIVLESHWASLASNNSSWESESHRNKWALAAILNNKKVLFRRRFFLADRDLMGVTHEDAIPGDRICILYGMPTPVVLRPWNGHYILVGETFVAGRGYMSGAAMDEFADGKHQEEIFELH